MKGIPTFLYGIIALVISIIILLAFLSITSTYQPGKTNTSVPTYTWTDLWVGLCWGCCSATKTCTVPASMCY